MQGNKLIEKKGMGLFEILLIAFFIVNANYIPRSFPTLSFIKQNPLEGLMYLTYLSNGFYFIP